MLFSNHVISQIFNAKWLFHLFVSLFVSYLLIFHVSIFVSSLFNFFSIYLCLFLLCFSCLYLYLFFAERRPSRRKEKPINQQSQCFPSQYTGKYENLSVCRNDIFTHSVLERMKTFLSAVKMILLTVCWIR